MYRLIVVFCALVFLPRCGQSMHLGILSVPFQKQGLISSAAFGHLWSSDDLSTRGRAELSTNVVGIRETYGIDDRWSVSVNGGGLVDSKESAEATESRGSAGFLYGLDVQHDVSPSTRIWPGVRLVLGASGFQVPLARATLGGQSATVDQRVAGYDVYGDLLLTERLGRFSPYFGLEFDRRRSTWRDNKALVGQTALIDGKESNGISVVLGIPIQLMRHLRLELETILVNQMTLTAGLSWASF